VRGGGHALIYKEVFVLSLSFFYIHISFTLISLLHSYLFHIDISYSLPFSYVHISLSLSPFRLHLLLILSPFFLHPYLHLLSYACRIDKRLSYGCRIVYSIASRATSRCVYVSVEGGVEVYSLQTDVSFFRRCVADVLQCVTGLLNFIHIHRDVFFFREHCQSGLLHCSF